MAGNGWTWLEMAGMAGSCWKLQKLLKMAKYGSKGLKGWKLIEMAGQWAWLEMASMAGCGLIYLEITGNGWKWVETARSG